jgi:hypothetical protein
MLAVVVAMIVGLFNQSVDNAEIFKVIDPAFQTIVGALVGLVCGRLSARKTDE